MRKYLDMENATLEVQLKSNKEYEDFLKKNISNICDMNFQRVIFNTKEKDIDDLIAIVDKSFANSSILTMINCYTQSNREFDTNSLIINTNPSNILEGNNIYNKIDLVDNNLQSIDYCLKNSINLIVNPIIDYKDITTSVDKLNYFISRYNGKDINLDGFLISTFLVKEHPCNAYLCDGCHCKNNISALPKKVFVNSDYEVYPHDLFYDIFKIGNVKDSDISSLLESYYLSENYNNFISYSKKVFVKYLTKYPFELIPLTEFIKKEVESND